MVASIGPERGAT